jgi:hypothetical protein
MRELTTMALVGQTEAGSVEVQPARDSQLKAMNCRWGGRLIPAIPFCRGQSQFSVLTCLKKPDKKSPAKGGFLIIEEKKNLKTKSGLVLFTLNQYSIACGCYSVFNKQLSKNIL